MSELGVGVGSVKETTLISEIDFILNFFKMEEFWEVVVRVLEGALMHYRKCVS